MQKIYLCNSGKVVEIFHHMLHGNMTNLIFLKPRWGFKSKIEVLIVKIGENKENHASIFHKTSRNYNQCENLYFGISNLLNARS